MVSRPGTDQHVVGHGRAPWQRRQAREDLGRAAHVSGSARRARAWATPADGVVYPQDGAVLGGALRVGSWRDVLKVAARLAVRRTEVWTWGFQSSYNLHMSCAQ